MKELKDYVRSIPDFPEKGIIFRDITSILNDADGLSLAIDKIKEELEDLDFDIIPNFTFKGKKSTMQFTVGWGEYAKRKKGKLPLETISVKYDLEYGSAELEVHKNDIKKGQRAVIVDDLMATGGTIEAIVKLLESQGVEVLRICFVMELAGLEGRKKLESYDLRSLITYEGN